MTSTKKRKGKHVCCCEDARLIVMSGSAISAPRKPRAFSASSQASVTCSSMPRQAA
jgi:hypothetical protein